MGVPARHLKASAPVAPRRTHPVEAAFSMTERAVVRWLVPLAVLHGLLFLVLLPPWQHYDETAHFLYAAEIAAGELAAPGPASVTISREIADSMYRFQFFEAAVKPDFFGPQAPSVGISQRVHPPLYYAIVAIPLRFLPYVAIEQQLYAARAVSLVFYVLTIITAWRIALVLFPMSSLLQVVIPILVLLSPAFVDIMTAVNNDVLLNFSVTAALLGAVLLVRDGLRPLPLVLTLLAAIVAIFAKRVALAALLPIALALIWSVWRAPQRWWLLPLASLGLGCLLIVVTIRPVVTDGPSGLHTIFAVRPWFAALADGYMRLNLDATVRSFTDPDLIGTRYSFLIQVSFSGFWGHFAWGQIALDPFWIWIMAGLSVGASVGLLICFADSRPILALWQRRCLVLFVVAVVSAWLSLFIRLHPLPPLGIPVYIPRGRYMFWALVPSISLLVVGLLWLVPQRAAHRTLQILVALFVALNAVAWLWTIPNFYYR